MAFRTIEVVLDAITTPFSAGMASATAQVRAFDRTIAGVSGAGARGMRTLGFAGVAMGAAVAGGAALAIKAAINYESAFAGVAKTVDATDAQLAALSTGIRSMSTELPASAVEIAGVAEAAGQLGVRSADILTFTRVMVDLGETTNLTAEEAAVGLARFSNIMGTSASDVERLGATLVDLGNKGASTEAEILELGLRLAGAGRQAGLSEADVLGFANGLSSLGIEAEAGGTAFSRVFIKISDAVLDGGEKLDRFAEVAGQSSEEFRRAYEEDAAGAILSFTEGLGRIQDSGGSTTGVLKGLELGEIRVSDALRRGASSGDLLRTSIENGNQAQREGTALQEEAAKRYATTASALQVAANGVVDLAIGFGDRLLPAVRFVAVGIQDLTAGFRAMSGTGQTVVTAVGGLAGSLLGVGGAALLLAPRIRELVAGYQALSAAHPALMSGLGKFGAATAAVSVGIGIGAIAMGKAERAADDLVASLTADVDTSNLRSVEAALSSVEAEMDTMASRIRDQEGGLPGALGLINRVALGTVEALTPVENSVLDTSAAFGKLSEEQARLLPIAVHTKENIAELGNRFGIGADEAQRLADRVGVELSGSYQLVVPPIVAARDALLGAGLATEAAGASAEAAKAAHEALKGTFEAMSQAVADFTAPMTAYEGVLEAAGLQMGEFSAGVQVDLAAVSDALEKQLAAQEAWASNLGRIAARGRMELAVELSKMGPEGAGLVQSFADTTGGEFERAADLWMESVRRGAEDSGEVLYRELSVMAEVGRQGAAATAQSVAAALGGLPGDVAEVAARMGVSLAGGVEVMRGQSTGAIAALADEVQGQWDTRLPAWQAGLHSRWAAAAGMASGMLVGVPPVVGAMADAVNAAGDTRLPAWQEQMHSRWSAAAGMASGMLVGVPPVVGAMADNVNAVLRERYAPFSDIVGGYQGRLEGGMGSVLEAAQSAWRTVLEVSKRSGLGLADGGIVEYYRDGGEHHVAQVAPAGAWRVWAEPETGGEAYIPLALAKRERSVAVLEAVAQRFGLAVHDFASLGPGQEYAAGGIALPAGLRTDVPPPPSFSSYGAPIRPAAEAATALMRDVVLEAQSSIGRVWQAAAEKAAAAAEKAAAAAQGGGGPIEGGPIGGGDIVAVGRSLVNRGYRVGEHPAFGGVAPVHTRNSWHYKGRAIDVNWSPASQEPARLDAIHPELRAKPHLELIWRAPGHYNHLHYAMAAGGLIPAANYDQGGYLPPGVSLAVNTTGAPERVGAPVVSIARGAVQVDVRADAGVDADRLGEAVTRAVEPALAAFGRNLRLELAAR